MRFNAPLLAFAVTAAMAAALPEPVVSDMAVYSLSEEKVKRAAFAINDILERHTEAETVCSEADGFCEQQRRALDNVAGSALDGYDELVVRDGEMAKRWNHKKLGKHSDFHKNRFGFTGAPGSDSESKKVKRWNHKKLGKHSDFHKNRFGFTGAPGSDSESKKVKRWNHKKLGKHSDFWKNRFGFTGAPGSDSESKKRDLGPDSDFWKNRFGFTGAPGSDSEAKVKRGLGKHSDFWKNRFGFTGAPGSDSESKVKRWNHKELGKHSDFWKNRFGFTGAPGSDSESKKVKRDEGAGDYPEALINHCDSDASYCRVEGVEPSVLKRDALSEDVAETMQQDGVGETLIAIRDAVDAIKRDAEGEDADDAVEAYFEDLDDKVKRAVALLED